jgi:hypothetical protein
MTDPDVLRDVLRANAERVPSHYPIPPAVLRRVRRRRIATAYVVGAVILGVVVGTPVLVQRITDRPPPIQPAETDSRDQFPVHPRNPDAVGLARGTYPTGDEWILYTAVENGRVRMGSWRLGFPWTAWYFPTDLPVSTNLLKGWSYVSFESDGFATVEGMTSSDAEEARIELEEGAPITIRLIDAPPGLGASVKFIKSTMPLGVRGHLVVSYSDGTQKAKVLPAQGDEAEAFAEDEQRAYLGCLYRLHRQVKNPRRSDVLACENADPTDYEPEDIES